jgi:branched-chain amino acid transport system permease protein
VPPTQPELTKESEDVSQLIIALVDGVSLGATYALIALGLVLIFRATTTFNFAHGHFMLLGAYLVASWQDFGDVPLVLVMLAGIAVVAAAGWVLFRLVLRRIVGAPPFVGVIATLGFAAVADALMLIIFGNQIYTIDASMLPSGTWTWGGARVSQSIVVLSGVSLLVAGVAAWVLERTQMGAKVRAAGQDVLLASQSGINVHRVYGACWAAGCALAGLAGITYGSNNAIGPEVSALGLLAFPAILLGGLDSIGGSVVGAMIIGLTHAFTASFIGGTWTYVTTYSLLLVVILVKPSGLYGTVTAARA